MAEKYTVQISRLALASLLFLSGCSGCSARSSSSAPSSAVTAKPTAESTAKSAKESAEPSPSATAEAVSSKTGKYLINMESGYFHVSTCEKAVAMSASKRKYSDEKPEDLVKEGYKPCGKCLGDLKTTLASADDKPGSTGTVTSDSKPDSNAGGGQQQQSAQTASTPKPTGKPSSGAKTDGNTGGGSAGSGTVAAEAKPTQKPCQVVHHYAEGHNESVPVVVREAYDEQTQVYVGDNVICNGCGAVFTSYDAWFSHMSDALNASDDTRCDAYHVEARYETQTIHHDAEMGTTQKWVEDKPAYDETICN